MGVRQILEEWTAWRMDGVRRRTYFVMKKKQDKLHLLKGLKKILLDIDKAIQIIRETEEDAEVVPNLMIGFGIDQVQAEYVAEIKLRNINKEYILKRVNETAALQDEIADLEDTLNSPRRVKQILADELTEAAKKYGEPRRTSIVYSHEVETYVEEDGAEDYPVHVFLSREGYFKKITPASLRMAAEQKYKDGDGPVPGIGEHQQRGDHVLHRPVPGVQDPPQRVRRHQGQRAGGLPARQAGHGRRGERGVRRAAGTGLRRRLLFFFENGKAARVDLTAYQTTSNRRKLTGAYSDKAPLACIRRLDADGELAVYSSERRCLIFHTALLAPKTTRTTQGVAVMNLKPKYHLETVKPLEETAITNLSRYRVRSIPAAGALVREEDAEEQQLDLLNGQKEEI